MRLDVKWGEEGLELDVGDADWIPLHRSIPVSPVEDIHAAQQELERRGVTFTGAPHMIFKHPDGLEEWLTFFHEPDGGLLSLISQVRS